MNNLLYLREAEKEFAAKHEKQYNEKPSHFLKKFKDDELIGWLSGALENNPKLQAIWREAVDGIYR